MRRCAAVLLGVVLGVVVWVPPAEALCAGSSLCNPANAPILAEFGTTVPASSVATGSTATSVIGVASPTAAAAGGVVGTTTSSALGGTLGLAILGGGIAAWNLILGDGAAETLPEGVAGGGSGTITAQGKVLLTLPEPLVYEVSAAPPTYGVNPVAFASATGSFVGSSIQFTAYCNTVGGEHGATPTDPSVQFGSFPAVGSVSQSVPKGNGTSAPIACGSGLEPVALRVASTNSTDLPRYTWVAVPAPGAGGSVNRTVVTTITCKDSGGNLSQFSDTSVPFTSTDPGTNVPVAGLQCPDGQRLTKVERVIETPGAAPTELPELNVPPELDQIPQPCFSSGTVCELELQREVQGDWLPCHSGTACPETWPGVLEQPEDYRCRMVNVTAGTSNKVPLGWCSGTIPWPQPEDDPEAPPRVAPSPDPVPWSDPYPDPGPAPEPQPLPEHDPWPGPEPVPGPGPAPGPGPGPAPAPGSGDYCDIGWSDVLTGAVVVKAVVCALQIVFVPSEAFLTDLGGSASASWNASGVGQWTSPVLGLFTALDPVASGCEGPTFPINLGNTGESVSWSPLSTCTEPAATASDWTYTVTTVLVIGGALLAGARWVLRSFGIGVPSPEPARDGAA